jgi:hypothetical protein
MELKYLIKKTIYKYLNEQKIVDANIYEKNFKKWFKNSEVVNNSGEPLVLYHGSENKDFNEFKITKDIGFHFAVSKNIANNMVGKYTDEYDFTHNIDPLEVYLSIQKLGALPDLELWRKIDLIRALNKENEHNPMNFIYDDNETLLDNIKRFSFEFSNLSGDYKDIDGFIYYNRYEGRFNKDSKISYIALKPNQIKSVNNDGTFDTNDNNIFS